VYLTLKVWPRPMIRTIKWSGNTHIKTKTLQKELGIKPKASFNRQAFNKALNKVKEFYVKKGYFESQLQYAIIPDSKTNEVDVLIDVREGDKVDFWILTPEPVDQSRFARRKTEDLFGMHVKVSSPEDTILAKLRWADLSGGSEKQFTDALRVYEVQRGVLDIRYIETWVERLGVGSLWARLLQQAGQTE
ncbi:MAG: POTRA domain-containing protein, partial [Bacteroidota bacterium]